MTRDQITIIVLNWNRKAETLACLESLEKADLGGATVLVVDNGSRDGSVEAVRERFPHREVIALPENRGYAGGNNAGIRAALERGAEAVLLLNNDTVVSPDFLPPLLWALDTSPYNGAVCSAIHRIDRPEMLDVAYAEVHLHQHDAVQLRGVNALPGNGFESRRQIEVAVGCSLLIIANALRDVGLFDESYFAYHEDVDWCLRARRIGYQLMYEPMSRVFHRGSGTTGALTGDKPDMPGSELPDLPNAEALPWNPLRTYLGARNLIRLLGAWATPAQKRSFALSCAYEIPLEMLAVVLNREGWMRLGRWSYGEAARVHFIERRTALLDGRGPLARLAILLSTIPFDLLWTLPRAIADAARRRRLDQLRKHVQGLWDGFLGRPLPLRDLGLT